MRCRGEAKSLRRLHQDVIHFDEDGAAELDGEGGFVPYVDGGGTAADVRVALEDGDIGWYRGVCSILSEMVGC
jgi:hypothetical protein